MMRIAFYLHYVSISIFLFVLKSTPGSIAYPTQFQAHVPSLIPEEPCWFHDFGASNHMATDLSNLTST